MKTLLKMLVLLLPVNLYAHEKEFTVFYSKGKVEVVNALTSNSAPLKDERAPLFNDDKIRLYNNAYVILFYNGGANPEMNTPATVVSSDKGASIELKNPGTYSVDSLALVVKNRKESSVIADYISFLGKEFKNDSENIEEYSKRHMMDKGGVARGDCDIHFLMPPISEGIVDSSIIFVWSSETRSDFVFRIYKNEEGGRPLFNFKTRDTIYKLNVNPDVTEQGKSYYWSVAHTGDEECMRLPFKILNNNDRLRVKKEINDIDQAVAPQNLKSVLKAACYEKNFLYMSAREQYLNAIKSAPQDEGVKKLYDEFLARTGVMRESLSFLSISKN